MSNYVLLKDQVIFPLYVKGNKHNVVWPTVLSMETWQMSTRFLVANWLRYSAPP